MPIIAAIIVGLLGLISIYKVALWTYWLKYDNVLKTPLTFASSASIRILYWVLPLSLLAITIVLAPKYGLATIVIFYIAGEIAVFKVKRQEVRLMTKAIMEDEHLSYKEARKKAKQYLKAIQWAKKLTK